MAATHPDNPPPAAAHNCWWRDHGFESPLKSRKHRKRQETFELPEIELYVSHDEGHKYGFGDVLVIDDKRWGVVAVVTEPEHDQAVIVAWPAEVIERYVRGEE